MRLGLFLAILFLASNACAISLGYVTGNDYREMTDSEKSAWLAGAVDGVIAESISANSEKSPWLSVCIGSHEFQQIKAIFEKELTDNPEGWHAPAALIFRKRIKDFCGT